MPALRGTVLAKVGEEGMPPEEMAKDLETLFEHLDAVRKFYSNDRFKAICGSEFDGLNTDFNTLLAVNDFARQVVNRFLGTMPIHREVRRLPSSKPNALRSTLC